MTFESIYNSLEACTIWFFGSFFNPLINFIKDTPLLSSAILIVVGLPAVMLIFDFFKRISLNFKSLKINNKKQQKNSYNAYNYSKLRGNQSSFYSHQYYDFDLNKNGFTIKRKNN